MKRFLVLSVATLLLLVSVAKCESEEEPETVVDVAEDDLEEIDLGVGGNSTTSRPKRQNYDIYSGGGMMGGGGGGDAAAYAVMGGGPGGGMAAPAAAIGGIPGGPIGGPIGGIGGIGGMWPPWDPCQPPWGCPRCPQLSIWHPQNCQNFCYSRKWCLCQWW